MRAEPWLLLLYSLPTESGSARVGVWRKVKKTGALPFKTSAYLLPNRPHLQETFEWLAQQVTDAGGEASVAFVAGIGGLSEDELVLQFNEARAADFADLADALRSHLSGGRPLNDEELNKLRRRHDELQEIDFFGSPAGREAASLLERALEPPGAMEPPARLLNPGAFAGRTWLTRPGPAIDRVGSAWLIRRFIDPEAAFVFAAESAAFPDALPYDMTGVEFSHHGDDCTFETLLKRFALRDPALAELSRMIHDADLGDSKFGKRELIGLDRIFKGWAALGLPDDEILARGMPCFDALYEHTRTTHE